MSDLQAEDTYLELYETYVSYRDELGETLEAERSSDFLQGAQYALLFVIGGLASGILSRLGESMVDSVAGKLKDLAQFRKLRSKREITSADHQVAIAASPAITKSLRELDPQEIQALGKQVRAELEREGYTEDTAKILSEATMSAFLGHDTSKPNNE